MVFMTSHSPKGKEEYVKTEDLKEFLLFLSKSLRDTNAEATIVESYSGISDPTNFDTTKDLQNLLINKLGDTSKLVKVLKGMNR